MRRRRVGGLTRLGTPTAGLDGMTAHVVIRITGASHDILVRRSAPGDGTVLHCIPLGSFHGPRLYDVPVSCLIGAALVIGDLCAAECPALGRWSPGGL